MAWSDTEKKWRIVSVKREREREGERERVGK